MNAVEGSQRAPLEVVYTPDPVQAATALVEEAIAEAVAARGRALVCLSGGQTPLPLYAALAAGSELPWERVTFAFSDERYVEHTHKDNNYGSIASAFLARLPTPPAEVLAWPILASPESSAAAYAQTIDQRRRNGPLFDLTLLGIGADGHTASLFPGTGAALDERTALASEVPGLGWRLSLSAKTLSSSRTVLFLVTGAGKADALRLNFPGAFGGDRSGPDAAPASAVGAEERLVLVTDSLAPVG